MSITAIVFLCGFLLGAALALLRHPAWGVWLYLWTYYNDPFARWWGTELPDIRWSLIAAVIAAVALLRYPVAASENRPPWYANWGARLLLLYVVWVWIQTPWAVNREYHIEGAILFTKYLALYIVIYRSTLEPWGFDTFALAHILGCGILGWFAFGVAASGRLEGIGPPNADDANSVAVQLVTGLVFCSFYFLLLRGRWWLRLAVAAAVPFIVNTIILAASRGSVVAILGTLPVAMYLAPKKTRLKVVAGTVVGLLVFVGLANDVFWSRMDTMVTGQYGREARPETRLGLINVGVEMAKDYPLGAGHRGFEVLSPKYVSPEDLTDGRRAAHNTIVSVLVDQGIPGLFLFLALVAWCVRSLVRARRAAGSESGDAALKRAAVGASLAALFIAGQFSNLLKAEVQIWFVAMLAALDATMVTEVVPQAIARAVRHPLQIAPMISRRATLD